MDKSTALMSIFFVAWLVCGSTIETNITVSIIALVVAIVSIILINRKEES